MRKLVIAVVGLIAVLALTIVAAPRLFGLNTFKPSIAAAVKEATGRDLVIGGDIELAIVPGIAFSLADVSLSNAPGAAEPRMFRLKRVSGRLALLPLLGGNVVIERLLIEAPELHLEVDDSGRPNWVFDVAAEPDEEGLPVSGLTVADLRLEDGVVTYRDARTGQLVAATGINLKLALPGLADPFTLEGALTLNDEAVSLTVMLDSPGNLLAGRHASFRAALTAPRVTMGVSGEFQQMPIPTLNGAFDLDIPSVGALAAWLDRPLAAGQPDPGALKMHAAFESEGAVVELKEATIEGAALQARATGRFDGSTDVARISIDIEAGVLDFDRYLPPPAEQPMAPVSGRESRESGDPFAAISDEPFDLTPLGSIDADVKIAIGGIKALGYEVKKIAFHARLADGALVVELSELGIYDGNVTATITAEGRENTLSVEASVTVDDVDVGRLARAAQGAEAAVAGIASGRLEARGSGDSPRGLAKNLVATVAFNLGGIDVKDAPGQISRLTIDAKLPRAPAAPSVAGSVVYNQVPVAFTLELEALDKMLSGAPFAATIGVTSKPLRVTYDGTVQMEPVPGLEGRFTLDVPSIGRLAAWLGQPLPEDQPDPGPVTVDAVLIANETRIAVKDATIVYNREPVALTLELDALEKVLSGAPFAATIGVTSKPLRVTYDGTVRMEPVPGLDGRFALDIPSIGRLAAWLGQPLPQDQPDPGPVKVRAVLSTDGARIAVEEATVEGKAIKLKASASVDSSEAITHFAATIELIEANLDDYLPPAAVEQSAAGEPAPAGWSEEPIEVAALREAEGRVDITIAGLRYRGLDIEGGGATITLSQGVLDVEVHDLRLAGGTVDLAARVDAAQKVMDIGYRLDVTGVQARPVLIAFADTDRLSGSLDLHAEGRARGLNEKQLVATLNGEGRFAFTEGAIHGINIASTLRNVRTLGFGESGEQKTDFAELSGSFKITDGVLENRDLALLAPLVRLEGGGLVSLPPQTVDYRIVVNLVASLEGQGAEEALAGLPIPVTVKGPWDNTETSVDWKSVFAEAARDPARLANMPNELRSFGQGLGINLPIPGLSSSGGGLLGGVLRALGGADQPPATSDTETQEDPAPSLLQSLFGRKKPPPDDDQN